MGTVKTLTHDEQIRQLNQVIERYKGQGRKALMQVLQEAQDIFGYLPLEVQRIVADGLGLSVAEVYGVITFILFFHSIRKVNMKSAFVLAPLVMSRAHKPFWIKLKKNWGSKQVNVQKMVNFPSKPAVVSVPAGLRRL